jgi:hypothetical protein
MRRSTLPALLAFVVTVGLVAPAAGAVIPIQPRGREVSVTVTYTGKGPVDATHEIWVFMFDTPNIGQGVRPLSVVRIKKSGDVATFRNVKQESVYVAVDEKGDYDGNLAPPPAGTPIAYYTVDGKPIATPVKTAGGAKITLTFSDAIRMQQALVAPPQKSHPRAS